MRQRLRSGCGRAAAGVVFLSLGGCASSAVSALTHGVRHFPSGDRAVLLEASIDALVAEGFAVDVTDRDTGVVTTRPLPASQGERVDRTASGDRLSPNLRRLARVQITQAKGVVSVYCRVTVQEQVTEAHRMFRQDHRPSDLPGETPIEREAATTEEQNTVWRTVRRDREAERRLLEALPG